MALHLIAFLATRVDSAFVLVIRGEDFSAEQYSVPARLRKSEHQSLMRSKKD
jgi:hypothetical protein